MSRALAQTPSDNCIPDNWAVEMVLNEQGTRLDGTPVLGSRSIEANALGNNNNFFSLGFGWDGAQAVSPGGRIRLRLAQPAFQHTGSEVLVVEATGGVYPLEQAAVYVSPTNSDGTFAGVASNVAPATEVSPDRYQTVLPFPAGVTKIEYITLIDITDPAVFTGSYNAQTQPDGFDVVRVGTGCANLE
jgi:hypothetical protein